MITDSRINEKGELVGKVQTPQWDEMYTKDDIVAVLKDIADEINKRIQAIPYSANSSDIGVKVGYMYSLSLINANINALKENINANV